MSEEAINNTSCEISSPFLNYCNQLLFCPISGMLLGFHRCLNLQFQQDEKSVFLVSCYDFAFPYAFFSFYAMISKFCGVDVQVSISKTNIVYLCFFFKLFGFLICVYFFFIVMLWFSISSMGFGFFFFFFLCKDLIVLRPCESCYWVTFFWFEFRLLWWLLLERWEFDYFLNSFAGCRFK